MAAETARSVLEAGFAELNVEASSQQIESLANLSQLLFRWSKRINLTGHRSELDIVRRLVLDALALAVQIPDITSLADIGSGAGFPGFPIAILRPQTRVVMIESRERRHHFQREAIRTLGLENVEAQLGRAEQLTPSPCSAAIAQAVAPAEAVALLLRWVTPGGLLLFPASEGSPALSFERNREQNLAVRVQHCVEYRVPCGGPLRRLWVASQTTAQ